jgi:hypothetical protein
MLRDVLRRVELRLQAVKLTPNAASKKAGVPDAIRNMRRAVEEGREGVSTATLEALAPVLQTTAGYLIDGSGEEATSNPVAVAGYVGAGAVATLFSEGQGPFDYVEAPWDRTPDTIALEIRGASLGPAFDDGLVFYDDVRSPVTPDLHGRLCVVGLADGRVLVKILRPAADGRFHLLSNSTEEPPQRDQEVAWAARVKEVRPR